MQESKCLEMMLNCDSTWRVKDACIKEGKFVTLHVSTLMNTILPKERLSIVAFDACDFLSGDTTQFFIGGKTYEIKDMLKKDGFWWYADLRLWGKFGGLEDIVKYMKKYNIEKAFIIYPNTEYMTRHFIAQITRNELEQIIEKLATHRKQHDVERQARKMKG